MTAPIEYKERQDPGALRAYLSALKAGTRPLKKPIVPPQWQSVVEIVERQYTRCGGNPEKMKEVVEALCKDDITLSELLNPPPSLARVEAVRELGVPPLPEEVQLPTDLSQGACHFLD